MAALLRTASRYYKQIFYEYADRRSENFFLVGSPLYPLGILILYMYLVKTAIPRFMKDREAYRLNRIIAFYNIMQIVLNMYIFIKSIKVLSTYNLLCQPVDYSDTPQAMYVVTGIWEYFAIKVLDLMDTIFFVLRKKNNQATFLHLYHHIGMVAAGWGAVRYFPGGQHVIVGAINTFVHIFMYSYYFVTNMWPKYKKNLWWKKHVTQLQMVQFMFLMMYFLPVLLLADCQYPAVLGAILMIQNGFIWVMFYEFYRNAYGKQKST